ncbi:phytanoyl-CoA dioxygenase family protein [Synechococcus sp. WH 8101]|nr:phytanoyl-CoA dioxygenase family protein [Synechococcus sp. WH 8101]
MMTASCCLSVPAAAWIDRQGVMREFCAANKVERIRSLIQQPSASESSLEASVRGYGQHWDFRENLWKDHPELERWLLEEEPAQLAADLLCSDRVWLLRDQTYCKRPGSELTPWHQDALFIPVEGCEFLTIWIPLSSIRSQADAPLEYWRAPHPCCELLDGGSSSSSHRKNRRTWTADGRDHTTTLGLKPGDCSYHDGWTLHGSDCHEAATERLAIVAVYGCGEGVLRLAPAMSLAPQSLRGQSHLLREGLHRSCFPGLREGDPVPSHHNPWIRCSPRKELT